MLGSQAQLQWPKPKMKTLMILNQAGRVKIKTENPRSLKETIKETKMKGHRLMVEKKKQTENGMRIMKTIIMKDMKQNGKEGIEMRRKSDFSKSLMSF